MPQPQRYGSDLGPRTGEILEELSLDEKAAITAGSGLFYMTGVERLGIPDWYTTDGPNGARGSSFLGSGSSSATCVPCGSALGATWNPSLIEQVGELLGSETRMKAARVLLAPTVNLHRSPLGGRNFECFSEDPLLSGVIAAAYIRGVQSQGVITTIKHFIGNEAETDRQTMDSVIDPRPLRELYLVPFEYAIRDGGTLGLMTSYNRVNGEYVNNQAALLTDILTTEWGYQGMVTTDWMAAGDTVLAANAGVTIEMPSGDRILGTKLARAVRDRLVDEAVVTEMAGRMLSAFEAVGALDDKPGEEKSIENPAHDALARRAAADAMVLLHNRPPGDAPDGPAALPLDVSTLTSIAVIGQNANRAQISGGGSANLRPFHRTTPLAALRARLGDSVDITYARGCNIDVKPPLLGGDVIANPRGGQGFLIEVWDNPTLHGDPIGTSNRDQSRILFDEHPLPGVLVDRASMRATTIFTAPMTGIYTFRLEQVSPARMTIDGTIMIDGIEGQPLPNGSFFGLGGAMPEVTMEMFEGVGYDIVIEVQSAPGPPFWGADLRMREPFPADALTAAVAAAAEADVAVVVVGTNDDWESEGYDRTSIELPGDQNELVSKVAAVNPHTVVVVNTGAPVSMPWVDQVSAIVQTWFGGQGMADALVDVLVGDADPAGRLPTTFPRRLQDNPTFGHYPGENGIARYSEGLYVGYRWYDARDIPVLFPFGHGGSYTTFELGPATLSRTQITAEELIGGESISVRVPVTNTGSRRGSHVVQLYVRPHDPKLSRPDKELKGFAKVDLKPGETITVEIGLNGRSFAYWDPAQSDSDPRNGSSDYQAGFAHPISKPARGWTLDRTDYDIVIANSATDIDHVAHIAIS